MSTQNPQTDQEPSISNGGEAIQQTYITSSQSDDFGFYFWAHVAIIITMYLSPFLVPISVILFGLFLYRLQLLIFKGCILTHAEFGSKDMTQKPKNSFYGYYLAKIGIYPHPKKLTFILNVIVPIIIFSTAIIWQLILRNPTYFF